MNTDIYTVAAAVESTDPAALFFAIIASLLFFFAIIAVIADELELSSILLFLGAFVGVLFLMLTTTYSKFTELQLTLS